MTETPDPGDNQEGAPAAVPDLAAWMAIYGARLQRYFTRRAPPADGAAGRGRNPCSNLLTRK
jgi:hypothetical protein